MLVSTPKPETDLPASWIDSGWSRDAGIGTFEIRLWFPPPFFWDPWRLWILPHVLLVLLEILLTVNGEPC